jgi:septation ring formation regulator EzrA
LIVLSIPISEVQKYISDFYKVLTDAREHLAEASRAINNFEFYKARGMIGVLDVKLGSIQNSCIQENNALEDKKKSEEK